MIKIMSDASHNKHIFIKIGNVSEDVRRSIRRAGFFVGKKTIRDLSRNMLKKPRQGRVYHMRTSSGRRRKHVASIAGETPANITGFLRRSREFLVSGWQKIYIGYSAYYGKWLEGGTKKMEARPGLEIAVEKNDRFIKSAINKGIKGVLL